MARLLTAFERLSKRERVMVGSMLALVFLLAFGIGWLWLGSAVSDMETRLAEDRAALQRIHLLADRYRAAAAKTKGMQRLAEKNRDTNLRLAINDLAKNIGYEHQERNGDTVDKKLSDVMQYEQKQETFLSKKKRRGRRKKKDKDTDVGYWQADQTVKLSEQVPFKPIYTFLERVEASDQMLFVTDIDMRRLYQDGRVAKSGTTVTVSTYYYKGKEE